jgi:hypothetical protein
MSIVEVVSKVNVDSCWVLTVVTDVSADTRPPFGIVLRKRSSRFLVEPINFIPKLFSSLFEAFFLGIFATFVRLECGLSSVFSSVLPYLVLLRGIGNDSACSHEVGIFETRLFTWTDEVFLAE